MSAQDVLSQVAWQIGQKGDEFLFSNKTPLVQQVIALMFVAGNDIAGRTEWQKLHKSVDIPANADFFALPADFREITETGALSKIPAAGEMSFDPVRIIVAPEQWQLVSMRPSAQMYAHLTEGKLRFSPNTGATGVRMRYVSKNWNLNGNAGLADADEEFAIPERLLVQNTVWRWRRQKGLEYNDLLAEYEADLAEAVTSDRGVA